MDPVSAGLGIVGLGMKIFGGLGASSDAAAAYRIQQGIAANENQINDQRHNAMLLASRRQQLEIFRNNQRARALALNAATNQGAQLGTGLQGGLAQIQNQSTSNLESNNQSLEIGQNVYGYNNAISQLHQQLADVQSSMATNQAISSIGGSLMSAGPTIGNISKGFGGFNFNSIFGGGSPSGYGA